MRIKIENIAKVDNADIKLDGITVIAGVNGTGKSTVSRSLYAILDSFYHRNAEIRENRRYSLFRAFANRMFTIDIVGHQMVVMPLIDDLISQRDSLLKNKNAIRNIILNYIKDNDEISFFLEEGFNDEALEVTVDRVSEVLSVNDNKIVEKIVETSLRNEFYKQINNIKNQDVGKIEVIIRGRHYKVKIKDDKVIDLSNNVELNVKPIYFDNLSVFDLTRRMSFSSNGLPKHFTNLRDVVEDCKYENINHIEKIFASSKIDTVEEKLNEAFRGSITTDKSGDFKWDTTGEGYFVDVHNLSMGMKTFALMKILLENSVIGPEGVLILDEPEVHLHPQWQILFAEIIVLLQIEFNLHVLINTHSPYMLDALDVYLRKYDAKKNAHFYRSANSGEQSVLEDVTGNIELIFKDLVIPIRELERIEY